MIKSKLRYFRNLEKEKYKIELLLQQEHQKRVKNTDRIALLENNKLEIKKEQEHIRSEITEWIDRAPISEVMKEELRIYYVKAYDKEFIACDNFDRTVDYLLGEQGYVKKRDKKSQG